MTTLRIPCTLMRGGTSRGLVFRREHLPARRAEWDAIFLAALGSPDPRQLDGVGAGDSHTSKVAIVNPCPDDGEADMEFLFGEVAITEARVDYAANSGNIIAALGLYAVDEGWVEPVEPETRVRVRSLNNGKIVELLVPVADGRAAEDGDFTIDGVPGPGPRIEMVFPNPEGTTTGKLLPTGQPITRLDVPGIGELEVSLVDSGNPIVCVKGEDFDLTAETMPNHLNAEWNTRAKIQAMRSAASVAMGLVEHPGEAWEYSPMIPYPVLLFPPSSYSRFNHDGPPLEPDEMDICARVISLDMAHKAINVTVTVALTSAAMIPGTLAHRLSGGRAVEVSGGGEFRIGHPSGVVRARGRYGEGTDAEGAPRIASVGLGRTARRIMDGEVLIQPHKLRWLKQVMGR